MRPSPSLSDRLEELAGRHHRALFAALAALALLWAWHSRFVLDDAFISFQYARDLAEGRGLTWFGARVEGYSDFLWVLWMALGFRVGAEPIAWSWAGGLASFVAALGGSWRLARSVFERTLPAVWLVLLLAANFTFRSFATGGLETMLQAALLTWALVQVERLRREPERTGRRCARISLLLGAACLARMDSALPAVLLAGAAAAALPRAQRRGGAGALLVLPAGILIGGWLAWKLAYYGSLFPLSFYAKTGGDRAALANGLAYVGRFFHWYWIWPVLVLGLAALFLRAKPNDPSRTGGRRRPEPAFVLPARLALPAILVVTWLAYVIGVGGDFMEFRFLVPVAPSLFLLIVGLADEAIGRGLLRWPAWAPLLVVVLLSAASLRHSHKFRAMTADRTLDSVPMLATFYGAYPDRDWSRIGARLGSELAGTNAVLAMQAVGAIPYYSRLSTVDMLGLNEPEIARHGWKPPASYRRPGHRRQAATAYLRERGVNFVLGHPRVMPRVALTEARGGERVVEWLPLGPDAASLKGQSQQVVLFPVADGRDLLMWYLVRTPELDALLRRKGWPVLEIKVGG